MLSYTNYIRILKQTYREIIRFDISLFSEVNKFDVSAETVFYSKKRIHFA